jgi:Ca2+-binding RTX toxin-like protein
MQGFAGNDMYYVDNAADKVIEAAAGGSDRVFAAVNYTLTAGAEIELFTTTNSGGTDAINLTGNEFAQTIQGNAGANIIDGKAGADTMQGFAGNDMYYVDNAADKVIEAAASGSDRVFAAVNYTLTAGAEIELFTTTNSGGTGALNLTGNEFAQTIQGNAGANIIDGKAGADTMQGFAGADTFVFSTTLGAANIDNITDFSVVDDTIQLARTVFTGLGINHVLDAAAFVIGTAATNANQHIIYNSATGNLYFDDDGNGAHAAQQFAHISAGLALTNSDFFVA